MRRATRLNPLLVIVLTAGLPEAVLAQGDTLAGYLRDRGTGVPASIFGTYIGKRELLIYPLFEYARDHNKEGSGGAQPTIYAGLSIEVAGAALALWGALARVHYPQQTTETR